MANIWRHGSGWIAGAIAATLGLLLAGCTAEPDFVFQQGAEADSTPLSERLRGSAWTVDSVNAVRVPGGPTTLSFHRESGQLQLSIVDECASSSVSLNHAVARIVAADGVDGHCAGELGELFAVGGLLDVEMDGSLKISGNGVLRISAGFWGDGVEQ